MPVLCSATCHLTFFIIIVSLLFYNTHDDTMHVYVNNTFPNVNKLYLILLSREENGQTVVDIDIGALGDSDVDMEALQEAIKNAMEIFVADANIGGVHVESVKVKDPPFGGFPWTSLHMPYVCSIIIYTLPNKHTYFFVFSY